MILSIPLLDELMKDAKFIKRHHLYDSVDRLHFIVTVFALMILSLIIGAKQHFGQPIDCLIPKEQDGVGAWREYIENYCLMYGTYRYNTSRFSKSKFDGYNSATNVQYYQWVAFFLAGQAVCFLLPHWIWTWMQKLFYLDMTVLIDQSLKLNEEKNQKGVDERIERMINYAYCHFRYRRLNKAGPIERCFRQNFVACGFYLIVKLIFLANVIGQLFLLNHFLGFKDVKWGFDILLKYISNHRHNGGDGNILKDEVSFFAYFPVLVACDYHMYTGISDRNQFKNTVQCILPMNVINEKMFVGVYLWFILLLTLTSINILSYIFSFCACGQQEQSIYSLINCDSQLEEKLIKSRKISIYQQKKDFVHNFMGADGVLLFRFMSSKTGTLWTRTVIRALWDKYLEENECLINMSTGSLAVPKKEFSPDYAEFGFGDHTKPW